MKSVFAALLVIFPFFVNGQSKIDTTKLKHPVKACLFQVTGNGLEKPCWLFGTIHLGVPSVTTLHPRAEAAFKESDGVYTEIDMDPRSQMAIAPLLIRKDGKTLTQAVGPKMGAELQGILTNINPALKLSAFNPMKTWVVAVTLPLLKMQLNNEKPLDALLYTRAQKEGKTVGALETAASQVSVFEQFSEKEIHAMLADTIKTMKEDENATEDSITRLLNVYLTGDVVAIAKFMKDEMAKMDSDPDFTNRLLKALLDDRNIGMAEKADEFMKAAPQSSHFFAIGAAHYTGRLAVQDLLRKKGYKITPAFQ